MTAHGFAHTPARPAAIRAFPLQGFRPFVRKELVDWIRSWRAVILFGVATSKPRPPFDGPAIVTPATPGSVATSTAVESDAPPSTTTRRSVENDASRSWVAAARTSRPWSRIATWSLIRWTSSRMWVE